MTAAPDASRACAPARRLDLLAALQRQIAASPPGAVEIVRGGAAVGAMTYGSAAAARKESLSLEPVQSHLPQQERSIGDQIDLALGLRGVRQLVVIAQPLDSRTDAAVIEELARMGSPTRYNPTVPLRMLVYDRSRIYLAVDPDNTRAGAYVSDDPALVALGCRVFAHLWDAGQAPPTTGPSPRTTSGLTRLVIEALTDGLKDEAIARRIGVSARTVRRVVAQLQIEYETTSRFQLALLLAAGLREGRVPLHR